MADARLMMLTIDVSVTCGSLVFIGSESGAAVTVRCSQPNPRLISEANAFARLFIDDLAALATKPNEVTRYRRAVIFPAAPEACHAATRIGRT